MKASCEKCGKIFDMEEHLYICPKCNHYHSQVIHARKNNIEKTNYKVETKNIRKFPKKIGSSKGKLIGLIIIIIFFVFPLIMGIIGSIVENLPSQTENVSHETYPTSFSEYKVGEEISFEGLTVVVEKSDKLASDIIKAPKGWKYEQFYFNTYQDDFDWNYTIKASLECGGLYYKALSAYQITSDQSEQDQLYDLNICDNLEIMDEGYLIFLVPEDTNSAELKLWAITHNNEIQEAYSMLLDL